MALKFRWYHVGHFVVGIRKLRIEPVLSDSQAVLPLPSARITIAGQQQDDGWENTMARRRYQNGTVFLRGKKSNQKWVGRFRIDEIGEGNKVRRVYKSVILGSK